MPGAMWTPSPGRWACRSRICLRTSLSTKDARIIREFCEDVVKSWKEILLSLRDRGADVSQFFLERARSQYSSER